MKLEEGMYVRNEDGYILKLTKENIYGYKSFIGGSNIKIKSYNLIDLIEEGDYVNGQLVYYDEESECLGQNFVDADSNYYFESITKGGDYKIKTIVTKQQFESMKYEVKEDEKKC